MTDTTMAEPSTSFYLDTQIAKHVYTLPTFFTLAVASAVHQPYSVRSNTFFSWTNADGESGGKKSDFIPPPLYTLEK